MLVSAAKLDRAKKPLAFKIPAMIGVDALVPPAKHQPPQVDVL